MTIDQLAALSPLIVLGVASVLVMLVIAFYRNHALTVGLTIGSLGLAFLSLFGVITGCPTSVTSLIIVDSYSVFFTGLVLAACMVVTLLSHRYLAIRPEHREDYYLLVLLVALGAAVIVSSSHFAAFFLGLEILSVAFYALIAYMRGSSFGLEAGLKYLVLAAVSDSFLLFGMAAVFAQSGSLEFTRIAAGSAEGGGVFLLVGLAMFVTGIGFKLSLVPFHMWTPDVYQGAPAPVTALLATVSKGAVFALLLRYSVTTNATGQLESLLRAVALASMFAGTLLALLQDNVKRILAYSSISHFGYLLVALLAPGELGKTAVVYYLTAYFVTILGAFGVVIALSGPDREADNLDDYRGLFWDRPWLAGIFTLMLLSLAGIPLTAGFLGKFYVMAAGLDSRQWVLVAGLILTSLIGIYYYLRIVVVMFGETLHPEGRTDLPSNFTKWEHAVLAVLAALVIWFGTWPSSLIRLIQNTVAGLS